jgi:hypothetical protein
MFSTSINLLFLIGLNFAQDIQIHKNELSNDMEKYAIAEALLQLKDSDSNEMIAKNLANQMDIKFGKQWFSFVGMDFNNSGFNIDHQKNTFFWFSYKQKHIILFKPQIDVKNNLVFDARKDNAKVTVLYNDMEEKLKTAVINTTSIALKNFNTFQDISLNITKTLNSSLGSDWRVFIDFNGFASNQEVYKNISIAGSLILFRVEDIEFVIFRFLHNKMTGDEVCVHSIGA